MKYIDIHSHLNFKDFDSDREKVIADMLDKNIGTFTIGTTLDTSLESIALADKHSNMWSIVGIHPIHAHEAKIEDLENIELLLSHPKCIGIGECGMDLFRIADNHESKQQQITFFEKQIELTIRYKKPLMIHCREAYPETLEILKSYKTSHPELHAHFHFFTESIETARTILNLGFTVSFTGVITFVSEYEELVKFAPLDSFMIETDSPYVSPKSNRGKRNDPRNVIEIAQKIADIKNISLEEVATAVRENTRRVFGV